MLYQIIIRKKNLGLEPKTIRADTKKRAIEILRRTAQEKPVRIYKILKWNGNYWIDIK